MAQDLADIISIDNGNTAVEIKDSAFEIGKVLFNFIKRGPDGKHPDFKIQIYMDIPEFLLFSQSVKNHLFLKKNEKIKTNFLATGGCGFPAATKEFLGGTSKASLAAKGRTRPDKMSESRVLKLFPATKSKINHVILQAECGGGEEANTGIIIPRMNYTSKDPNIFRRIQVGTSYQTLESACLMVESRYNGYIASQYVKDAFKFKKEN